MSLRLLSLRLPFKKIAYRYASQAQRIWGGVSRLELETPKAVTQNSRRTLTNHYPSPYTKIATYRDGCPFRLIHSCLLLTMQSFTQAYAVLYTVIRYHALLLIPAYAVVYFSTFIFVAFQQITQSLTPAHALTNAIALELQQLHFMY